MLKKVLCSLFAIERTCASSWFLQRLRSAVGTCIAYSYLQETPEPEWCYFQIISKPFA